MTRVLVVEDSRTQAAELKFILEAEGFAVELAVDGEAGLACVRAGGFDLVISDIVMPRLSGYDLCRQIKADPALRDVPVILLTALTDPRDIVHGLVVGADNFLTKPCEPEHLVERIRGILANRALRAQRPPSDEVLIVFHGQTFGIASSKQQVVDLLIATFEDIVRTNQSLQANQTELAAANAKIEDYAHRLEERVRASEGKYRSLVEHAQDGIVVSTRDGKVLEANREAEAIFGQPLAKLQGRAYADLVVPAQRDLICQQLGRMLTEGAAKMDDVRIQQPCGRVIDADVTASLVDLGGEQVVLTIVRDVTQRKLAEQQSQQSEKLATVGTLAAGIAHEINNPIAYVLGNLELLRERVEPLQTLARGLRALVPEAPRLEPLLAAADFERWVADLGEALDESLHGAQRVREIVYDLKEFAHIDEAGLLELDVNDRLESALRMALHELKFRARLEKDLAPDLPCVVFNPGKLNQLFLNMIVNAAQAIEEGKVEQNVVRVATRREGEFIRVDISDTGKGIPPEVLPRIFDPFFTTKPVGQGTGLGLAICHDIAKKHGGEIRVQSEVGKGTIFSIFLPVHDGKQVAPAAAAQPVEVPRLRLLIIDDEPNLLRVYERMLAARHEVATAGSGRAALDKLAAGERFDAILCDMMMADVDGIDVYHEVARCWPGLERRIVFMSGGAFTPRAQEFLALVPNRRLTKPFQAEELAQALAKVTQSMDCDTGLASQPRPQ